MRKTFFAYHSMPIRNKQKTELRRGANTMKNRYFLVFVVIIVIALGLAACERSASTPPPEEGGAAFPTLEGTQDPIDELNEFVTQTAMAESGESGEEEGGESQPEGGESQPEEGEGETPAEEPDPTAVPDDKPTGTPVPEKEYSVPNNYTLQKGEFPFCIARRFDISPSALLSANGLSSSSVTYAGQTLKIPKDAGSFDAGERSLKAHPAEYTVRAGDTVFSIACQYGSVDPRAIEDHNGLSGAYTIKVGQVLVIP
jgi:LysM repeat protein